MTLYGVRMPVFRAGDMVACRSISERCFVDLAAVGFHIGSIYIGATEHMGCAQTTIGKHLTKFNNVGMDKLENGDGQARAFAIVVEDIGILVQDGYSHEDGVGAEETFAQDLLRLLRAQSCEPHVLNKVLRGNSVRKCEHTGWLVLYCCLYSRLPTPGTPRDLRKDAIERGLLATASAGPHLRLSDGARQFVVEWFLDRGSSGGYGDCARELKGAFPDEPPRSASTIQTVYSRLAERIPGLPQPRHRETSDVDVAGDVSALLGRLDDAGRARLETAAEAARRQRRPPEGSRICVQFFGRDGAVFTGGSGPNDMWCGVVRGREVFGADPDADWVGAPEPFDHNGRWDYAPPTSEPAAVPSPPPPPSEPLAAAPPSRRRQRRRAPTTTASPTAPPPKKKRKTNSGSNERPWSPCEHDRFVEAFMKERGNLRGDAGKRVLAAVPTRSWTQVYTCAQKFRRRLLAAAALISPTTTTSPPPNAASTMRPCDDATAAPLPKRKKPLPPPFTIAAIRGRIIVFSGEVYIDGEHVTERQLRRLVSYLGGEVRDAISYQTDYVIAGDVNSKAYKVVNAASRGATVVSDDGLSTLLTPEMFEKADAAYLANLKAPVTKTLASLGELAGACVVVTGRDRELERMALCAKLRSCGATTKDKVEDVKKATFVVRCAFNAGVTMTEKLIEARSCGIPVVEVANLHALWRAAAPAPCAVAAPSPRRCALAENVAPSA